MEEPDPAGAEGSARSVQQQLLLQCLLEAVLTTEAVWRHQDLQGLVPPWMLSLLHSPPRLLARARDLPMVQMARALQAMVLHHQWGEAPPGEGETGRTSSSPGRGLLTCRASAAMEELRWHW